MAFLKLTIQQYFTGEIGTALSDGGEVGVDVTTEYPWDGTVTVTVRQSPGRWTLRLRIPAWATGATVDAGGEVVSVEPGYAEIGREWADGDVVVLRLPMAARLLHADPRIDALRGTAAVQRGPLVYCAESVVGGHDVNLDTFRLDAGAALQSVRTVGPSDTAEIVRARGVVTDVPPDRAWPYAEPGSGAAVGPDAVSDLPVATEGPAADVEIDLVPYYAWSNRGPSTMRVWIPVSGA